MFVLVGGGASGSVLASRLSDDPRLNVLLLEAGGEESIDMWNHVPLWNPIQHGSQADWGYLTTPQKHACKSAKNQVNGDLCYKYKFNNKYKTYKINL